MKMDARREELVHDAVKRLVGTPGMESILSFYARTNIHSDMEKYVLNEVARNTSRADGAK
jgi:hypothetical protein